MICWPRKALQKYSGLPPEILWSFEKVKSSGSELFNMELFPEGSESFQTVLKMFKDHLEGNEIIISEIYGVFSESLLKSFSHYYENLTRRFNDAPNLFKKNEWTNQDSTGLRLWMIYRYKVFASKWPWNANCQVEIIPQLHGTDFKTAKSICNAGFATLSTLDGGWYGRGIYFTHSGIYATPYFSTKKHPALIISYVIPGNVYPVCEHPKSIDSLIGSALKGGYQSHFIITTKDGMPVEKPAEEYYSEIVIFQEAQCVPAFILRVDDSRENLQNLMQKYQRIIVEPNHEIKEDCHLVQE